MQRIATLIAFSALLGLSAGAQNPLPEPPPAPAQASRASAIDAQYGQADLLIRQINKMDAGPEKLAATEELRRMLMQIDEMYTDEEKADSARRKIETLREAVEQQRQRLISSGRAMAQAKNAEPPDPADIQVKGSDYTLQEAILKALEVKVRQEERNQTMGTSEALRLMQSVE